jgi:hypothetical protein
MGRRAMVIRRMGLIAGGVLLLIGASMPSSCRPTAKPLSSLYGEAAYSRTATALSDPPCPPGEAWGYPVEGVRQKWGFLVAGAGATSWLTLRPCVTFASAAGSTVADTSFRIVTPSGSVSGSASGFLEVIEGADGVDALTVVLTVSSGTRSYREARGELYLVGCTQGGTFSGVELRADRPADLAARCYALG